LNQPTSLTGAEQRNAFFGPVRAQIKEFVEALEKMGLGKEFLAFSNSKMAYHDAGRWSKAAVGGDNDYVRCSDIHLGR
jgi:hypothetical protein